jgi:site-specific recombinase XerD
MKNHPLENLSFQYLAQKDLKKASYDLYEIILRQYISYLKHHQILYAKTSDIKSYIKHKKRKGYSPSWIHHIIIVIKGFYKYLSEHYQRLNLEDIYAYNIAGEIKNEPLDKSLSKDVLSADQAKYLILKTKENRRYIWHYRDYAIIYLMVTTAMRSVEIRRAKISDLQILNNQTILYVQGKGKLSKLSYVKITKGVKAAIEDYLIRRSDDNPYLFISHSKRTDKPYLSRTFFLGMLRRVLREAGLEHLKITPHSLRHTAATLNLLRGSSLEETRRFMRHKSMDSTLVYAHHINKMKDDSEDKIESYILSQVVKTDET